MKNHENEKSSIRNCPASTKLTPEQKKVLKARAEEKGLSENEYLRSLILQDLYTPRELRVMVASHVRMEKLVLVLLANLANGQKLTNEQITKLAGEVDKGKFRTADERIFEAMKTPSTLKVAAAMEASNA